jgi:DNA-binding transcriptional LysR family regulator
VEIRQIEHFLAVVDEGQFTRAASKCLIAQSGLSASIRALERDLGTSLLRRSTRSVSLTDAGSAFVPEARRIVAAVASARETVQSVVGMAIGSVSVGTVFSAGLWFDLPNLLASFHRRHPGVEIHLSTGDARDLMARVSRFDLDLALMGMPTELPSDLQAQPVATASYVFACSADHPLAKRRRVTIESIADELFIDLGPGTVLRQMTERLLASAKQTRTVRFEVHDVDTALRLVSFGLGSTILAEPPGPAPTGVKLVPIDSDMPEWTLALVAPVQERASRAALAILDEMAQGQ